MENVVKAIQKAMDERGLSQAEVVRKSGVSKRLVSDLLSMQSEPKFANVFNIVRYVAPTELDALMYDYCLSVSRKNHVLSAFEYAASYKCVDLRTKLFENHADSKNAQDICTVYQVEADMLGGNKSAAETIQECREYYGRVKMPELKIKLELIEACIHYGENDLTVMMKTTRKLEAQIDSLTDGFVKDSFSARLNRLYMNGYLFAEGDDKKAEQYAYALAGNSYSSAFSVATAYHAIGQANVFRDTAKSVEFLEKAADLYREVGYVELAEGVESDDIPFAMNVGGMTFDIEEGVVDGERAHQLIVRGENEQAAEILNKMVEDEKASAIDFYYLGKATNDITQTLKSYKELIMQGNNHHLKLVENSLKTN